MEKIRFTIITITSNNPGLTLTQQSVKFQNIDPSQIEHIIIDNMSTDNTQKLVEKYQKEVEYKVTYIREPDTGRYQGMNKGIKTATGDYLLFLNAGDYLYAHDILKKVVSELSSDIVYGDINGRSLANNPISQQFFLDRTIFHQAAFIKKELFTKYGLYDESLVISADFDFFIKTIIKYHATTKYLPLVITNYDPSGISSTHSDLVYQERAKIICRYYSGKTYLYNLTKYFYYRFKKNLPSTIVKIQQERLNAQPKI